MKGAIYAAAAVIALFGLAGSARATHVQCGDTITQTTVLDSDIVCTQPDSVGVYIGASDVTLWMAKHTISSTGGGGVGVQAIPASGEYTHVEIRKGSISGFGAAVHMAASDSSILKVSATGGPGADIVRLVGDRNYVYSTDVVGAGPNDGTGIYLDGDDPYAYGNTVSSIQTGILSDGDRPRVVLNRASACGLAAGIAVLSYTTSAVVYSNQVSACYYGIYVRSAGPGGGGARVRYNELTGYNNAGLVVDDATALIGRNIANTNSEGIHSERAGTRIQNNTTNDNGGYGIFAAPGTVDGGGNVASGNGTDPQCVNVTCSSP